MVDEENPCEDVHDMIDEIENDIKFLCDLIEGAREVLDEFYTKKKMDMFDDIYEKFFGQ